jgi:hypothetical protein
VLNQAKAVSIAERVARVTQSGERWREINRLHATLGDGREFAEALEFLGGEASLGTTDVANSLAASFTRPFRPGRFSNGAYGVLYTARKHRTANKERAYWIGKSFSPATSESYKIRLQLISCMVRGHAKDVRGLLSQFPWLIDDDYTQCRALAMVAKAEGLRCLITPSARDRPKGTTVPIFEVSSVSQGRQDGVVIFTIHAGLSTTFRTQFT